MAEDMGDKTEAPTPRRRAEAREQGNIARSADLTAAAVLIGVIVMLDWYGGGLVKSLRGLMNEMLGPASMGEFSVGATIEHMVRSLFAVGAAMAPMLIGVLLIALIANVIQVGFIFNPAKLAPNPAALNPMKGLGKLLGGGKGVFGFGMNLMKLGLVGAVAWSSVAGKMGQIVTVQQLAFMQIFGLGAELIHSIAMRLGILLLVLAIIDYLYQRFRIERELRMTKQEVKDEMKRMEGDPHIKQRRREIARQVARNRARTEVPTADVVVTNPTEFAIAIKYDADAMHAPRVVAKGQGPMALFIRQIAVAHGVPILERKPLARALYKLVEVGQEIPEQFYSAVAEILAYVYELTGKTRRRQPA